MTSERASSASTAEGADNSSAANRISAVCVPFIAWTVHLLLAVKIHLITTGGTIEKIYSEQTGQVENLTCQNRPLSAPASGCRTSQIEVTPLMNKDSLEMTEEDRELVLAVVKARISERRSSSRTAQTRWSRPGRLLKQRLADVAVSGDSDGRDDAARIRAFGRTAESHREPFRGPRLRRASGS